MIIKNLKKGLIGVPLVARTDEDKKNANNGSMVMLNEGWNEIPIEDWPLAEAQVLPFVAQGYLELKKVKFKDNEEPTESTIQNVRADQARDIVKGCYNPLVLQRWIKDEHLTAELRNLVTMQIESIEKYEAPKQVS